MKLTSLDIKGFKSFADRTTIHFNDNITGIVGPNGCGKSNIVDSIRWVLGEQKTSHLRLDKMEHLIFNGTKKRKASNIAEVKVTFENSKNIIPAAYKTISITRRLFRNGESEYLLNDVPCRLKDITNLFLDTGVGKDSYAIIELAMVDDILNDKDNSRRKLFEQAAGISKYRIRKKETLNRLKGTSLDLERVEDLLHEIRSNLKTLESQARRAQRYYKIKDEYRILGIELAKHQLKDLKIQYADLTALQQKEEDEKNSIEINLQKLEADLSKQKLKSLEKERSLSRLQKEYNNHFTLLKEKENQRNLLKEQIKYQIENKEKAINQLKDLETQIEKAEDTRKELNENLSREALKYREFKDEVQKKQLSFEKHQESHTKLKVSLDQKQKNYKILNESLLDHDKKNVYFSISSEKLVLELSETEKLLNQRVGELIEIEKKDEEKRMMEIEINTAIQDQGKEYSRIKLKAERSSATVEQIRQKILTTNRELDARRNEYSLLKNLVDNLEGFPESIKFLKTQKGWADRPPLLSDIFYCDEEYRVALEKYLEPYMNYYIVRTFPEAMAGANLLNDASKGRASFFVLEAFRNYKPKQLKISGEYTSALEILEVDGKYGNLASFLLGNVYLADDTLLKEADTVHDENIVILAKSGRLIMNRYSLSGGTVGLFEGKKLGRMKNLDKLSNKINELEAKLNSAELKLKDQVNVLNELNNNLVENKLDEMKELLRSTENDLERIDMQRHHLVEAKDSLENKIKGIKNRLSSDKEEQEKVKIDLQSLNEQLKTAKENLDNDEYAFIQLSDQLTVANGELNECRIQFHKMEANLEYVRQEVGFNEKQSKQIIEKQKENNEIIARSDSNIEEKQTQLELLENDLLKEYANKDSSAVELQELEQEYYNSKGELEEVEQKIKLENSKKKNADLILQEVRDKVNDLKLKLASIKERLLASFNVEIDDLLNDDTHAVDADELQEKVEKIRSRLENYGEINPMAIEAHEEMKKRFDFITDQKRDLEEAKTSLVETISEIEKTAKDQFIDAFEKVRKNFQKVFRKLFTEDDDCDLVLLNPGDPLESGIEIIAKPKGKRPTIIDQLSGGEKTLTATALLFSLYLLKPAPFCVFDEVDAPLDDMNIDKFNSIIHQFSEGSQFIIVTHNKKTMTSVDVIYGVTMAEQGISQVVPVDFRNLN